MVTSTSPYVLSFGMSLAMFLMVAAGVTKKRLTSREEICRVCHHERRRCTCRWL